MDEREISEGTVTLTRTQWLELLDSLQSLTESNALLVKTIGYLLKQQGASEPGQGMIEAMSEAISDSGDPYDLNTLRRLMDKSE